MDEDDWIEVSPEGTDPVTVTQDRELPKDAPAARYEGRPEKWRTMNRAQRRAAKRGR